MRYDELPQSDNIEDRRGDGGGGGGGGFGFPMGGGGLGIGTIVILGIVGYALGIDPRLLIGGAEVFMGDKPAQHAPSQPSGKGGAPSDEMGKFVSQILGSADVQWKQIFESAGQRYRAPTPVGRRSPQWGRSIARRIRRFISTPRSSAISSAASTAAMPVRARASSRRLM